MSDIKDLLFSICVWTGLNFFMNLGLGFTFLLTWFSYKYGDRQVKSKK